MWAGLFRKSIIITKPIKIDDINNLVPIIHRRMKYKLSEIQEKQPIINIGTIGHVAHGKSTLVKALTGKTTPTHSLEKLRNMTIFIGHANLYIYEDPIDDSIVFSSEKLSNLNLKRHISLVDCPGHSHLMATMIGASKVFDGALLLIAANDAIPQLQTKKHVEVLETTDISEILILLNKIDLLHHSDESIKVYQDLQRFVDSHPILQNKTMIPICAHQNIYLQHVAYFMSQIPCKGFENVNSELEMHVLRSYDINHLDDGTIKGGILGGSILSGYIKIGDYIAILPGICEKDDEGQFQLYPILCQVKSLRSENEKLEIAFPGGLIAMGLDCDPSFCKQNRFLGSKIMKLNKGNALHLEQFLFSSMIVIQMHDSSEPLRVGSDIILILYNKSCKAKVIEVLTQNTYKIGLDFPTYVENQDRIPLMANQLDDNSFLGYATIVDYENPLSLKMPLGFHSWIENLPEEFQEIEIENDLPTISYHEQFEMNANSLNPFFETQKATHKIPTPNIIYEPLKILFVNVSEFEQVLEQKISDYKNRIISYLRLFSFMNVCKCYFSYVYGIEKCDSFVTQEGYIQINIKTKKLKHRLEKIISTLLKQYFLCIPCKLITNRIGKINNHTVQCCIKCGKQTIVKDEWIKNVKLTNS